MKTIAITIDETTLADVDRLVRDAVKRGIHKGGRPNRSAIVRVALRDYLRRGRKAAREDRDRRILALNRARLARQAGALVREQADL